MVSCLFLFERNRLRKDMLLICEEDDPACTDFGECEVWQREEVLRNEDAIMQDL